MKLAEREAKRQFRGGQTMGYTDAQKDKLRDDRHRQINAREPEENGICMC